MATPAATRPQQNQNQAAARVASNANTVKRKTGIDPIKYMSKENSGYVEIGSACLFSLDPNKAYSKDPKTGEYKLDPNLDKQFKHNPQVTDTHDGKLTDAQLKSIGYDQNMVKHIQAELKAGRPVIINTGKKTRLHLPTKEQIEEAQKNKAAQQTEASSWWSRNWYWVLLAVAVAATVGYFGFRKGGWFRSDKKTPTPAPTSPTPTSPTPTQPDPTLPDPTPSHAPDPTLPDPTPSHAPDPTIQTPTLNDPGIVNTDQPIGGIATPSNPTGTLIQNIGGVNVTTGDTGKETGDIYVPTPGRENF